MRELLPQHEELLTASAISDEVASERGYWSATRRAELEELGFGRKAQRVPSLVIPVHGVTGELEWCAHRPDEPRIADGTPRKYEIPYGAHQVLDVPQRVRPLLRDPSVPLIVTEGPRKVDSAISHGLVCIGVFGTFAFRGTDKETQGKVVLGDWEHVALKNGADEGREVYIAFDSDVMRKPEVQDAFDRLSGFLHRRGARVGFILLPEGQHGTKVGLDDFFAAGGSVEELWSYVRRDRPRWFRADDPDTRTNGGKGASASGKDVHHPDLDAPGQTPELARERDILAHLRIDLPRAGLAGELQLAQLIYLALTSRLLPWGKTTERPVSVTAKGSTSTGKSYATKTALRFFPGEAYFDIGSFSRRYLFYTEEELTHRFVYVPEWASIADDDELVAMLRTLLSEGRIVHGTVEGDGRRTARRIEKEGPTGLLMTTTAATVDPEMETRCLSVVTDDSVAQTRKVYETLAELEDELVSPVDFLAWHELQGWLAAHGETRVVVPFVRALAELMPASATRLRRDFVTLLCLVRAHAILHRATREQDEHGRIVATVEGDYTPVRDLVAALIAEGVEAGVSAAMRETVEAAEALIAEGAEHVSPTALTARLGVGRSATYDRIRRALAKGYLVNEATKEERRMRLVVGAPLPGGEDFLPSADAVVRVCPDDPPGQESGSTERVEAAMSGSPGRPADPPHEGDVTPPTTSGETGEDEEEIERLAEIARAFQEEPR
jgi:Domain of unknown function (DUF3854)